MTRESAPAAPSSLFVGIDVGSTTVKAVVVDPATRQIIWKDYQRHETRQPEKVVEFLVAIGNAFPDRQAEDLKIFVTGSGSGPLAEPIGARFVQEVNAVTLAVEELHPDVGSVVELGGQDAKVIIFLKNEETGERQAINSMNDKCASGTGATIDKCMIKVGMSPAEVAQIKFDATKLHHVASKCGVFAETDVVNLVKSGIPSPEIMCSLADAIVHQNLSVLTRGRTLRSKVLLLGGPNTYLPFLRECWRLRIPETWQERGYEYDKTVPIEQLLIVPEDAQYYAAFGAVIFGIRDKSKAEGPSYRGLEPLKDYSGGGRNERLAAVSGPPLATSREELASFEKAYTVPKFIEAKFQPGQVVRAVIGLDGGSTSSKAVLVGEDGTILRKAYRLSRGNPIQDAKEILADLNQSIEAEGATFQCIGFGATGYAAPVLEKSVRANVNIVETVAHMMAARSFFPDADVVCDIGGQDIKVLFLQKGEIKDFKLSKSVLRRQRHAPPGHVRPVRRADPGVLARRLRSRALAQVLLRLRGLPRLGPRQLPEGGLQERGAPRRPGHGAAQERLAVRRRRPAPGRAGDQVRPAGRHAEEPSGREGPGRLHPGASPRRDGLGAPALWRGRSDRRGHGDAPGRQEARLLDVRRPQVGGQLEVRQPQRREHQVPLLPEQLLAHIH